MDRQSAAFRNASPEERVGDQELADFAEQVHDPLESVDELRSPEDYESDNWDSERVGPKSLDEARAALRERIDNPQAPDGAEVEGAYDTDGVA